MILLLQHEAAANDRRFLSRRYQLKNLIRFNENLIEDYREQKQDTGDPKRKRWINNEIQQLEQEIKEAEQEIEQLEKTEVTPQQ